LQAAKDPEVKAIGMSALLTTTMIEMKSTIQKIKRRRRYSKDGYWWCTNYSGLC